LEVRSEEGFGILPKPLLFSKKEEGFGILPKPLLMSLGALLTLCFVIILNRCGIPKPMPLIPSPTVTPLPGKSLEWEEILSEPLSFYEETHPTMRIITTLKQASELEDFLQLPPHLRLVSKTDFSAYFVIAVFQGYKGCADYSIEVREVRRKGNTITVYANFLEPDPKEVLRPVETSPYYILKVKKLPILEANSHLSSMQMVRK
jgi:hypothetical protein